MTANQKHSHNYKGGSINWSGYKIIWDKKLRKHHREHRLIVENHLGRKLDRDEEVHHINGDKINNRIENLVVMSKSQHAREHGRSSFRLDALRRGNIKSIFNMRKLMGSKWTKENTQCRSCGTNVIKHGGKGLCKKCYLHEYYLNNTRR